MEYWKNDADSRKLKYLEENMSQCQSVHPNSTWNVPGMNPDVCGERPVTAWDMAWPKIIINPSCTSSWGGDEWVATHSGCFISMQRGPWYSLERRLWEPHSHFGHWRDDKNLWSQAKNWRPVCVLVTLPTELSWLTWPCISYMDKHPIVTVAAWLYSNIEHVLCQKALHWLCFKLPHKKQKKFKGTVLHSFFKINLNAVLSQK